MKAENEHTVKVKPRQVEKHAKARGLKDDEDGNSSSDDEDKTQLLSEDNSAKKIRC